MRRSKFHGIVISHLGNTEGRQPEQENTPGYVQAALKDGWHVCVDVVYRRGGFFFLTPAGLYSVPPALLSKQRVWCRAYDPDTVDALCGVGAHCFLHTSSVLTLTSAQFVWTPHPHVLAPRSIAVFPEQAPADWLDTGEPAGLCTDEPLRYI